MSEGKRKAEGRDKGRRRFRPVSVIHTMYYTQCIYHPLRSFDIQDGTPIWGQRSIDGPGVWVTCVKGKEKQTVGELYDLFESVSKPWNPFSD